MSSALDVKSVPISRLIALGGAAVMFIALFFPLVAVTSLDPTLTYPPHIYTMGWEGLGALIGILALALLTWEVVRLVQRAPTLPIAADLVTAILSAALTVLGVVQFFRALDSSGGRGWFSVGPGFGAFLTVIAAAALGFAAYLLFVSGGGMGIIRKVRDELGSPAGPHQDR